MILNIHSHSRPPFNLLSNFAAHAFELDGVQIASMEGFLQSLKFEKISMQDSVCAEIGLNAKFRGDKYTGLWKRHQILWWRGEEYDRHGPDYQALLDRAYEALFWASKSFREALWDTGSAFLVHPMGSTNPRETILTEAEFCTRLMKLRDDLHVIVGALERHG